MLPLALRTRQLLAKRALRFPAAAQDSPQLAPDKGETKTLSADVAKAVGAMQRALRTYGIAKENLLLVSSNPVWVNC